MSRTSNARIAGAAYLAYIAVAFPAMTLQSGATTGSTSAAKLASMAQHAGQLRLAAALGLAGCFCALILAVSLYAVTREEDPDVAMLGLTCRVAEGISGAVGIPATLALLAMTNATGSSTPDPVANQTLAAFVLGHTAPVGATFFAVGSTAFSWLLLRGRMIPTPLAWLGVAASALLVVLLPLQLGAVVHRPVTDVMWIPMAAFEIPLGVWFIVRGVPAAPSASVEQRNRPPLEERAWT